MNPVVRLIAAAGVMCVASGMCVTPSDAQTSTYPNRQVKVVVPFPPGGVVDIVARIFIQHLTDRLGHSFYVENRAGASGNIGAAMVQSADPDGYTVMITSSNFLINPGIQKVAYDAVRGFSPIAILSASPSVLAINPKEKPASVKELIEAVRKEPGKYSYASAGVGSPPHLQGEMFKQAFGLDILHVPFAGGGPALQSAVGGHTPIVISALPPAITFIKSGGLRGLAVIGRKRTSSLPDVPTMAEAGVPDQDSEMILLALAPARTPKDIVTLLNREMNTIVRKPEVVKQLDSLGFSPLGSSVEEASVRIRKDLDMWAKVIRDAKLAK